MRRRRRKRGRNGRRGKVKHKKKGNCKGWHELTVMCRSLGGPPRSRSPIPPPPPPPPIEDELPAPVLGPYIAKNVVELLRFCGVFFFFFFWSPQLKRNRRTLFSPTFPEITFFQPRRCQRYFLPLSSTIFQYCIVHYPNTLNLGNNEFYHLHQSAIGFFNLLILFLNFMLPSSPFFLSPFSSNDRIHAMLMWDQCTFSLPLFSHCHHVPNLSGFHWYAVLHWYVSSQG